MTPKEAAEALNGNQYREEGSRELWKAMKESGLVAVYGASDDLMEFSGAINDEIDAYEGTFAYVNQHGLIEKPNCDCKWSAAYWANVTHGASKIVATWDDGSGYSWVYETDIPHETFEIMEDDEPYCRGIVFALKDVNP